MDELKDRVMDVVNKVNQNWVKAAETAERDGTGLDVMKVMGQFSENMKELDKCFMEARQRMKKKKGFFN